MPPTDHGDFIAIVRGQQQAKKPHLESQEQIPKFLSKKTFKIKNLIRL